MRGGQSKCLGAIRTECKVGKGKAGNNNVFVSIFYLGKQVNGRQGRREKNEGQGGGTRGKEGNGIARNVVLGNDICMTLEESLRQCMNGRQGEGRIGVKIHGREREI